MFIEKCRETAFVESAEATALLVDRFFRDQILRQLGRKLDAGHRPLLLNLLDREARARLEPSFDDGETELFENIYFCALLIYRIGDVRDSLAIWKAKMTDMDTGFGMDGEFMTGAGWEATIAYLRSLPDPQATKAAEHLSRGTDYESIEAWYAYQCQYYSHMAE
ncbi:MAG: hypothetical protein QM783_09740 [Phycisphaerales bacterium]